MRRSPYKFEAYRGIALCEALDVLSEQRYFRSERVQFSSNCGANAVFGDGVYFTEHYALAAEYAQCHAITLNDKAAVLVQTLSFQNPLCLNDQYTEKQLRDEVLCWRFGEKRVTQFAKEERMTQIHLKESIRSFVLNHGFDSIVLDLPDGSKYFVSYRPEAQVSSIKIDFLFSVGEALTTTLNNLRVSYKESQDFAYLL